MHTILVVLHVFVSVALVGLVLIQHGKGADAGAAFGSGASATVFGARGSANFLSRTTAGLAAVFFVTSLVLAWFAMQGTERQGVMAGVVDSLPVQPVAIPGAPVPGGSIEVPMVQPPVAGGPAAEEVPAVPVQPAVPLEAIPGSGPAAEVEAGAPAPAGDATAAQAAPAATESATEQVPNPSQ
jgi:preprotein translocase subunit SecG